MSDAMRTEQLQPGKNPAGLAEGGQPTIGATHEVNTGFGEARDLGPGEVERMFGPAPTPRQRLEGQGIEFVESETETGGGGGVDPVEEYFAKNQAVIDKMGEYIEAQRKAGKRDDEPVNLGGQPLCTLGEYQTIYKAIGAAQARGDRRPIEEIVREARRPSPPPPEPQPAPRAGDWRGGLSPDQQQWLVDLQRNFGVDKNGALLALQNMIKAVDSNPRQLSGGLLPWSGSRNELRVILLRLGEEIQHQLAMENVLKLSLDRQQNTGEQIATQFLVELKRVLVKQFPNDLEKQNESVINLYERLRRDDALGFSPDIGLIPRGADIGVLMRILKSMLGRNGG